MAAGARCFLENLSAPLSPPSEMNTFSRLCVSRASSECKGSFSGKFYEPPRSTCFSWVSKSTEVNFLEVLILLDDSRPLLLRLGFLSIISFPFWFLHFFALLLLISLCLVGFHTDNTACGNLSSVQRLLNLIIIGINCILLQKLWVHIILIYCSSLFLYLPKIRLAKKPQLWHANAAFFYSCLDITILSTSNGAQIILVFSVRDIWPVLIF